MACTAALDQLKGRIHLIGTINGQINAIHRIQAAQGNSQLSCQHFALKRCCDADDVLELSGCQTLAKPLDHQSCRGTRSQSHDHAVTKLLNRRFCDSLFHLVLEI